MEIKKPGRTVKTVSPRLLSFRGTARCCEFSLGPGQRERCGTLENICDMQLIQSLPYFQRAFKQEGFKQMNWGEYPL
jgi:hypothetical protein